MKYMFVAPSLTAPTYQTLEEQAYKAFAKIERLLQNEQASIRISVVREGDEFNVTAELRNSVDVISKEKNRDLRVAIDLVAEETKSQLLKKKDKKGLRKMTDKIRNLRNTLLSRNIE